MKALVVAVGIVALAFAGCAKKEEAPASEANSFSFKLGQKGRFLGVGLYVPGPGWAQLKPPSPTSDAPASNPKLADLADDEMVIVVSDTSTGELRQCGNLSGHCVTLNPWTKPAAGSVPAPLYAPPPEPIPDPTKKPPTG